MPYSTEHGVGIPADQIRAALNAANLVELAAVQREHGRESLPGEFRQRWRAHHDVARSVLRDGRGAGDARDMAGVLADATCYMADVAADARPDYYHYCDLRLYDWYLRSTRDQRSLRRLCLDGVHTLCTDICDFETDFQAGRIAGHDVDANVDRMADRIAVASALAEDLAAHGASPLLDGRKHACVEPYAQAADRRAALIHLTGMPLTRSHDEYMFIRVLQASELCFFALRVSVTAAVDAVKAEAYERATEEIEAALTFTGILCRLLFVLRTMPISHFGRFRYNTGGASAIQSVNYQLLDVVLYGLDSSKIEHLQRFGHLKAIVPMGDARFVSLRDAVRRVDAATSEGGEFLATARRLDRSLLTWRGLHLSLAKTYIPNQERGTGDTSGASYLRQRLLRGLFEDEQPDWQLIERIMQEGDAVYAPRLRPGVVLIP
jgi:tryptophan 2,3-dioxygenase